MEFLNTDIELRQINNILTTEFIGKFIKCEKVINAYNHETNQYKRQIVITSMFKKSNRSYFLYNDEFDFTFMNSYMCKNIIVGEYLYYYSCIDSSEKIEEIYYKMLDMDYEVALDFFRKISNIEWSKHPLDIY